MATSDTSRHGNDRSTGGLHGSRRLLPEIRRAREYHLYGHDGRRYLDLFQDGGRAILGHRPAGLSTQIKNEISKGVLFSAPSPVEARLVRRLEHRHAGYRVRALRSSREAPSLAAAWLGTDAVETAFYDPAVDPVSDGASAPAAWDRPFLPTPRARVLAPILPVPGGFDCLPLLLRAEELDGEAEGDRQDGGVVDPGDPLPAFVLRACEVALGRLEQLEADLQAAHETGGAGERREGGETGDAGERRDGGESPAAAKGYAARDRYTPWDAALQGLWARRGPYLRFVGAATGYDVVFERYRAAGYLVNPSYAAPSILPRIYTDGERVGFAAVTSELVAEGYGA